ncbi:MAG TPA: HAD family phosphatase [Candidatus Cottocaccamicrobium excrementipullorum]|nr:HAD family phosphatase [Candidatus Cottocaccamicrobium excrementipullorum]
MTEAVIFDMDGVLVDSEPVYLQAMLRFAQKKNPQVKEEDIHGTVGRTAKDTWSIMEKAIHNGQSWQELRKEYHQWTGVYDSTDYRAIFRPEARNLIQKLKEKGYKLAVASSTHRQLVLHVLFQNQILSYFDVVVTGDMFTRSKPDPEIYHYTANALGVSEENCFVVEDSTPGITAAHRAGMKVAALIDDRFGFDRSLADYQVEKLEDIWEYL